MSISKPSGYVPFSSHIIIGFLIKMFSEELLIILPFGVPYGIQCIYNS